MISENDREDFYKLLSYHASLKGLGSVMDPKVCANKRINLFAFYNKVLSFGGYRRTTTQKLWKKVSENFNIGPSTAKQAYIKYLLDFEAEDTQKGLLKRVAPAPTAAPSTAVSPAAASAAEMARMPAEEATPLQETEADLRGTFDGSAPVTRVNTQPRIEAIEADDVALRTRCSQRLLRALQSPLPNEVEWALQELVQLTAGLPTACTPLRPMAVVSLLDVSLFDAVASWGLLFMQALSLDQEIEAFGFLAQAALVAQSPTALFYGTNVKRVLVFLWNAFSAPFFSTHLAFVFGGNVKSVGAFVKCCLSNWELLQRLQLLPMFLQVLEALCKSPSLSGEAFSDELLEALFLRLCPVTDRAMRTVGMNIAASLWTSSWGAKLLWTHVERLIESCVLPNALLTDDVLQNAAIDVLFALAEALERESLLVWTPISASAERVLLQTVDTIFHVILDNFAWKKHPKNALLFGAMRKSLRQKTSNSNAAALQPLACRWLLANFSPSSAAGSSISAADVSRCFDGCVAAIRGSRATSPTLSWHEFVACIRESFPKALSAGNADSSKLRLRVAPRSWDHRPVKTTEKVIGALLTLQNLTAQLPTSFVTQVFCVWGDAMRYLAMAADSPFLSKHFAFLLAEFFVRLEAVESDERSFFASS